MPTKGSIEECRFQSTKKSQIIFGSYNLSGVLKQLHVHAMYGEIAMCP